MYLSMIIQDDERQMLETFGSVMSSRPYASNHDLFK